jgi:hypothetical protein
MRYISIFCWLIFFMTGVVSAQSGEIEAPQSGMSLGSFGQLAGLNSFKIGKILVNPFAQVGYTKVASNIVFPISVEQVIPNDNVLQVGPMELLLQDASFWTGNIGLNAVINPQFALFGSAGGFAPKPVNTPTILPTRINGVSLPSEMDFTGERVKYWNAQVGGSYTFWGGVSLLGGYFWDDFTLVAVDPRIGGIPFPNQTLRSDFIVETGAPFIGLQYSNEPGKYRAALLYSPLARCDLKMPIRNSLRGQSQLEYTIDKPGQLLIGTAEYDQFLNKMSYFSLWLNGLWMEAKGSGELNFVSNAPSININRSLTNVSVTKYSLGFGLGLGIFF